MLRSGETNIGTGCDEAFVETKALLWKRMVYFRNEFY